MQQTPMGVRHIMIPAAAQHLSSSQLCTPERTGPVVSQPNTAVPNIFPQRQQHAFSAPEAAFSTPQSPAPGLDCAPGANHRAADSLLGVYNTHSSRLRPAA